jgi:hypothetical protein
VESPPARKLAKKTPTRSALPVLALLLLTLAVAAAPAFGSSSSSRSGPTTSTVAGSGRQVAVGIYINDIGTFDLTTGSFDADFYLWFRWQGNWTAGADNSTVLSMIATARANPTGSEAALAESAFPSHYEFMDSPGPNRSLISAQPHFNGTSYNFLEYRIRGSFHVPVQLNEYPLDEQTLSIQMEDSFYPNSTLVYVPDSGSVLDPSVTVAGAIPGLTYVPGSFQVSVVNHFYDTAFGYQVIPGGNNTSTYSRFIAQFTLARPFATSVTSLLLPVGIIIALAVVCFFIDAEKFEERLALLVTAVLTAVLLQVNFASTVPSDGQFTLADRVMLVVYAVLALGILIAVLEKRIKREEHAETIVWLDRLTLVIIPVATVIALVVLISPACAARSCAFLPG